MGSLLRKMANISSFCCTEHPDVKAFAFHPGVIRTDLEHKIRGPGADANAPVGSVELDTIELPAATTLYLTSGKADWLSSRYVKHMIRLIILLIWLDG
jgi:hypothetical protein